MRKKWLCLAAVGLLSFSLRGNSQTYQPPLKLYIDFNGQKINEILRNYPSNPYSPAARRLVHCFSKNHLFKIIDDNKRSDIDLYIVLDSIVNPEGIYMYNLSATIPYPVTIPGPIFHVLLAYWADIDVVFDKLLASMNTHIAAELFGK